MHFSSLSDFLARGGALLAKGPVALIFIEDDVEIGSSLRHALDAGFRRVVAFMPEAFEMPDDIRSAVVRVTLDLRGGDSLFETVNAIIAKAPGVWFFYCYNAEYLFFPFSESRTVGEMLGFHIEERRDAMLTYVIDLYAADLGENSNAVSLDNAMLDKTGYYALARSDPANRGHPKERQLDFYSGLRWRFEEHIPENRRKIDRISLFKAKPGLELRNDFTFNDEEYNTYSCKWHHNLTAAIVSFRTAKALKSNPGSTYDIPTFKWHNSEPFEWHSRQLLDLGLMEPGQWF